MNPNILSLFNAMLCIWHLPRQDCGDSSDGYSKLEVANGYRLYQKLSSVSRPQEFPGCLRQYLDNQQMGHVARLIQQRYLCAKCPTMVSDSLSWHEVCHAQYCCTHAAQWTTHWHTALTIPVDMVALQLCLNNNGRYASCVCILTFKLFSLV